MLPLAPIGSLKPVKQIGLLLLNVMDFGNILTGVPGYVMTGWVDAEPVLLHNIEAKVRNCACHLTASFHVSHTVGYKHGLLWLFSQAEVPLWRLYHSQSPMGYWPSDHDSHWALSVILTLDRMRLWPWHPKSKRAHAGIHLPLNVHSLRLFPEFLRDSWLPWDSFSFLFCPFPYLAISSLDGSCFQTLYVNRHHKIHWAV